MTIQIVATVYGHPWDLWGLSRLFDGTDASHILIKANKPEGRPTFDTADPAQVQRFRVHGYDLPAPITSDELRWDGGVSDVDLRDFATVAEALVARINGIAILLDPEYTPVKLYSLSYSEGTSAGNMLRTDWTSMSGPAMSLRRLGYGKVAKRSLRKSESAVVRGMLRSTWARESSMSLSY